jgi:hypothetical protein
LRLWCFVSSLIKHGTGKVEHALIAEADVIGEAVCVHVHNFLDLFVGHGAVIAWEARVTEAFQRCQLLDA